MIVEVFCHTANAVAAHLRLAAVGVEHTHAGVRLFRRTNQDQAIGADAEMPIADGAAQRSRIARRRSTKAIDVDIVVAAALHFGETHVVFSKPFSHRWTRMNTDTNG